MPAALVRRETSSTDDFRFILPWCVQRTFDVNTEEEDTPTKRAKVRNRPLDAVDCFDTGSQQFPCQSVGAERQPTG